MYTPLCTMFELIAAIYWLSFTCAGSNDSFGSFCRRRFCLISREEDGRCVSKWCTPKKDHENGWFLGWHPWILDLRIQNFEPIVMILRLREWRTILMMCPVHVWYLGTQTSEKLLLKWDLTIRKLMCCLGCLRWNPEGSDLWLASRP